MTTATNPSEWTVRYPAAINAPVVRRDIAYSTTSDTARRMDLYLSAETKKPTGAVVVASGYPHAGLSEHFKRSAREFGSTRSWCELLAGNDVAAIAYDAPEPATDLPMLIEFLHERGADLGIDPTRLGLFASSGNAPVALANLHSHMRCAVLLYGFMFDSNGTTAVEQAARQFGFANPNSQDAIANIGEHVRMLIVRAGRDAFAGLNDTIDAFVMNALARNLPLMVINQPHAQHAFDLLDESGETKLAIEHVLRFVKAALND